MTTSDKNKVRLVTILMALVAGVFFGTSVGKAAGDTYYVAQNGSDENSCATARNIDTPKRNIMGDNGGIGCMQGPGDTLLIRQGTYPESINNYTASLPSGADWHNAFTVAAYPGETVVIQQIAIATDDHVNLNLAYWIFDGLHVVNNVPDGGEAIWMRSPDHLRFVNMEVTMDSREGAACVLGDGNFIEFINVEVHRCGNLTAPVDPNENGTHGIYWSGSDSLFDHVKLHDTTGYGFHIYNGDCEGDDCPERIRISNSEVYNTGTGILLASGDGNQAYGNIVRNNRFGIDVGYGASDAKIYDNKVYQNNHTGISSGAGWGNRPDMNVIIENNIVASNGGYGIINSSQGSPQGEPVGTIIQNNTMFNNGLGINGILDTGIRTVTSNNLTSDVGL
jgi:parallel beta-helix repeat protein